MVDELRAIGGLKLVSSSFQHAVFYDLSRKVNFVKDSTTRRVDNCRLPMSKPTKTPSTPAGRSWETRSSLLKRLQAGDDLRGWEEFYSFYGGLIRSVSMRAGL